MWDIAGDSEVFLGIDAITYKIQVRKVGKKYAVSASELNIIQKHFEYEYHQKTWTGRADYLGNEHFGDSAE